MSNERKFAERLTEFMILGSLNATQLSEKTGISRSAISGLLRQEHLPSTKALTAFADYFHCTTDYLLGLTDDYQDGIHAVKSELSFGKIFKKLLKETKTTQYFLTKHEKISGNLIYKWLNDQAEPSVYNLMKLSRAMNVSVDCLLGRE